MSACAGLERWSHGAVGSGVGPLAEVAAALGEIGASGPSVLEIISGDADEDIEASHRALARRGWEARPERAGGR
jgi:deoxyribonuclease-4